MYFAFVLRFMKKHKMNTGRDFSPLGKKELEQSFFLPLSSLHPKCMYQMQIVPFVSACTFDLLATFEVSQAMICSDFAKAKQMISVMSLSFSSVHCNSVLMGAQDRTCFIASHLSGFCVGYPKLGLEANCADPARQDLYQAKIK